MNELTTDILIVGGGTGGCAAALAATSMGYRVIMTEETSWLGGQLTSQAVPPDEHSWIEEMGCTQRYRRYRDLVRAYYRDHYPLTPSARQDPLLNPGMGTVSAICCEPKAALAAIESMLAPAVSAQRLRVMYHTVPIAAETHDDHIRNVRFRQTDQGHEFSVQASYVIDATELGDLLPLSQTEYVTGAESIDETNEPHAVQGPAEPHNNQSISWCFHLSYDETPGAEHVIDKPANYQYWRDYTPPVTPAWTGRLFDWTDPHPHTLAPRHNGLFPEDEPDPATIGKAFWNFRKILAAENFEASSGIRDVTVVNWPMIDYLDIDIVDQPADIVAKGLAGAKQLSLSYLYWLQTEAPRSKNRRGYPELYLRPDIAGTEDGLAMAAYIRESRRIRSRFTVTENHVGLIARQKQTKTESPHAVQFDDSVGIGAYRIDLHPSTGGNNYIDIASLPFQIPLGSLIPVRMRNLLPACKNIGSTHITNGCYRLHPIEWNIGEAVGLLAGFCLGQKSEPHRVADNAQTVDEFQKLLVAQGIELAWPEAVRPAAR